jgi:transposase-like protein
MRSGFASKQQRGNGPGGKMKRKEPHGMEYRELQEVVRIRHQLRTLAAERDRSLAATLLHRMQVLAARDAHDGASLATEVQRWQFVFGLAT